jgi:hypothetical protein
MEQELLAVDPLTKPDERLIGTMTELKKAVDGIRATLWCYLEDKTGDVLPAPELIKMARMNRVVEMFREARQDQTELTGLN